MIMCKIKIQNYGAMVQVGLEVNNRIDDNLYAGGAARGTSTSAILYGCQPGTANLLVLLQTQRNGTAQIGQKVQI